MSLQDSSIFVFGYDAPATPLPQHEWDLLDVIPAKATIVDYGYVIEERAIGCTRPELIETVVKRKSEISLVWTPETLQPVRPEYVPFLVEAFRRLEAKQARDWMSWGAAFLTFGLLLVLLTQDWDLLKHNYLFVIGALVLAAGNWKYWRSRNYMQEDAVSDASSVRFDAWIKKRDVSGYTICILACFIVVNIFKGMAVDSVALSGLVKPAVWRGEVWRLFTATLVHASVTHLLFNAIALFYLSKLVEQTIQRAFVPLLFLVCAAVGSVFSLLLYPHTISLGASGGVMGLLGFIGIAAYFDRTKYPPRYFKRVIVMMLLLVGFELIAFESVEIDKAAHLGGLVAGLMLGWFCAKQQRVPLSGKLLQLASLSGILAVISTAVLAVYLMIRG